MGDIFKCILIVLTLGLNKFIDIFDSEIALRLESYLTISSRFEEGFVIILTLGEFNIK